MQAYEASLGLQLKALKLSAFYAHWQDRAEQAMHQQWSYGQYLSDLCQLETERREENRLKRRLKEADLPAHKTLSGFDFEANKQIDAAQINALAETGSWIKQANNLIIFGPSGVGKTHIAAGIAYRQIELGHRVKFFQTTHMVQLLQQSKVQFRLKESLIKLDKISLIVLDDFGYVKKDEHETGVLFELISHRYETGSLLITANQAFSQWDTIFPDSMMAVASVDRLVHHATIINIEGGSYRTNKR